VSTQDQKLHLQKDALKQAGGEKILTDPVGGASVQRPGLERARDLLGRAIERWAEKETDRR
jgi:hypothetical protein